MTITYTAAKANFAVVAADSLTHTISEFNREVRRFHTKVVTHPNLPIAVAASGIAELGDVFAIDRVGSLLETLDPHHLRLDEARNLLVAELLDPVREQLANVPPQLSHINHSLHLHIALWEDGKPRVGDLRITHEAQFGDGSGLAPPDPLHPWFRAHSGQDWTCDQAMAEDTVIDCVRETFTAAILADAAMHDGVPLWVGGKIRVAIVNGESARIKEPQVAGWPCSSLELPIVQRVAHLYAHEGWLLTEMPNPAGRTPPIFVISQARHVFINPLVDDRLLVKYATHELAGVVLRSAITRNQVPAEANNDFGQWQETLCRRLCTAFDLTEYGFGPYLGQIPPELEQIATGLLDQVP